LALADMCATTKAFLVRSDSIITEVLECAAVQCLQKQRREKSRVYRPHKIIGTI